MTQEKDATLWVAEGKVQEHEGAYLLAKQKAANLEAKMSKMELRLAEAESLISSRDKEVVDLKAALEESKDKFYDMGFADVEGSSELVMF